ncbi:MULTISPECIES: AMP-binding protein [unclassified Mycobacterium]|uniref:AMP-binding protein n=1 Tax=unclassified Mycobacterium TaxID=2642494 RepID=UPI0029C61AC2|nr:MULTISPECIES: AMP-binding protein [unclassified Mycobacterium]
MADFTFSPLAPTAFLDRAAVVFSTRTAIVDSGESFSYAEFSDRSLRLADALRGLGVGPGDRVASLCVNSHVMLELHNGVPYAGAVLVPMNTRLSVEELAYVVTHSGATVLIATSGLADRARQVAEHTGVQLVLDTGQDGEYELLLAAAQPYHRECEDERGLLAISYTSGTTGRPKGVMYHHRGAYLQSLAMAYHSQLTTGSRYLWTLPQFHCNGWCFTWAVTAAGATHVCVPSVDPAEVWRLIRTEGITHFSAAPTVLTMIANAPEASGALPTHPISVGTGGAPPSPTLLARMAALRMDVTHLYGLTETFGPVAINQWQPDWDQLPDNEQAELKARQGVGNVIAERLRIVDDTGADVPDDGQTLGRITCRGNDVMLGYYRDDAATQKVSADGWLDSGDLGVRHPDGYIEVRDRAKDIIISGGENIASVEIEHILDTHPGVLESAVVGRPDEVWGEIPIAFVTLRPMAEVGALELIDFVRQRLARFKAPKEIIFGVLPKTSTGKVQKNLLRSKAVESHVHADVSGLGGAEV